MQAVNGCQKYDTSKEMPSSDTKKQKGQKNLMNVEDMCCPNFNMKSLVDAQECDNDRVM